MTEKSSLQRELETLAKQNPAVARAAADIDRVTDDIIAGHEQDAKRWERFRVAVHALARPSSERAARKAAWREVYAALDAMNAE